MGRAGKLQPFSVILSIVDGKGPCLLTLPPTSSSVRCVVTSELELELTLPGRLHFTNSIVYILIICDAKT